MLCSSTAMRHRIAEGYEAPLQFHMCSSRTAQTLVVFLSDSHIGGDQGLR